MTTWTAVGPDSYFYTSWVADMGPYIGPDDLAADYLPTDAGEIDFLVGEFTGSLQAGTFTGPNAYASRYRSRGTERATTDTLSGEGVDPATAHLFVVWWDPNFPDDPADLIPPSIPPDGIVPPTYANGGRGPYRAPGRWSDWQAPYQIDVSATAEGISMFAGAEATAATVDDAKATYLQAQHQLRNGVFTAAGPGAVTDGSLQTYTAGGQVNADQSEYRADLDDQLKIQVGVWLAAISLETNLVQNPGNEVSRHPPGVEGVDFARDPDSGHYRVFDGDGSFVAWEPYSLSIAPGYQHLLGHDGTPVNDQTYVSVRLIEGLDAYSAIFGISDVGGDTAVAARNAAWPHGGVGTELARYAPGALSSPAPQAVVLPLDQLGDTVQATLLLQPQQLIEDVPFAITSLDERVLANNYGQEDVHYVEANGNNLRPNIGPNPVKVRAQLPRWRYWIPAGLVWPTTVGGYWGVRAA